MAKLTKAQNKAINEILEKFDFKKTHGLFNLMGWTYFDGQPSIERLKKSAKSLLESAIEHKYAESGRFIAQYFKGDNELTLSVKFDDSTVYVGE